MGAAEELHPKNFPRGGFFPDRLIGPARERLAAARAEFLENSAEVRNWRRLEEQLDELQARSAAAEKAPEAAMKEARRLLVAGLDPAPAEDRYRQALAERDLLANRLSVLAPAVGVARKKAEDALRDRLEQTRREIEAQAVAEAARLAEELRAAVAERLMRFVALEGLCFWSSGSLMVNHSAGRGVGETCASEFAHL
ncbi:MAG TPA: hypothetical protein VKE74_25840 [Gemmataceae bacterium]|nr:hypothetical protein [Gemmataceae bacterium]